jgi:hypothetical protein
VRKALRAVRAKLSQEERRAGRTAFGGFHSLTVPGHGKKTVAKGNSSSYESFCQ